MAEEQETHPTLVLELVDCRATSAVQEGSVESGHPQYLDHPSAYFIKTESTVIEDKKPRKIRFIEGAPTIYVDEQEKMGIKPNPLTDVIIVEDKTLTVNREGLDVAKYDYLKKHEGNINNPNRPPNAIAKFRELRGEEKAAVSNQLTMLRLRAVNRLADYYEETEGGVKYDEEGIAMLAILFGCNSLPTTAEKLQGIIEEATANPQNFLDKLGDRLKEYRINIRSLVQQGILNLEGEAASLVESKQNIYSFRSKDKVKREDELVKFFATGNGAKLYNNLLIDLEAKLKKALGTE